MFCIKCGARNPDEALFCQKCGYRFEFPEEEETRIAGRRDFSEKHARAKALSSEKKAAAIEESGSGDEEKTIFSIRPTLLFVKLGYALTILGAFLLVALLASIGAWTNYPAPSALVVLLGLFMLFIPGYFHLRQKMIRYTLTDSKVEIDEGLISKNTRNVPLRIIQDVTVSASFTQRLLGFGNIIIENANETDARIVLENINSPKEYASVLLKQMRRLNK